MTAQHTIRLPAGDFVYRDTSTPDRPTVLALHGMGRDGSDWDATARALAPEFRIVALDLRGHGQSVRTKQYSLEAMRDDVVAFVEALQLNDFVLLGFSLGGVVAYLYAQAHPARVRQLVTVDTPLPTTWEQPAPPAQAPEGVRHDWNATTQLFPELHTTNDRWWHDLARITCPALLLRGGEASWMPQDRIEDTARQMPDARVIEIPGGGHPIHRTHFPAFTQHLSSFLRGAE
ncbi:alpha/beta fold hydrolase [Deinococcus daejeonensis]|uniref:Peroxidase n=1 Tax=Deinococcus daejeonensis TaxID=1007098 RepID=A0ABQ2J813_9DEIO|nr:alpha/beta hydrolase [Deinococcus daejeonensis]GGN41546.1 peroxidase [Deinococcus daejeonensis]